MADTTVHPRLGDETIRRIEALRANADGPSPSRNAYVAWIVEREVERLWKERVAPTVADGFLLRNEGAPTPRESPPAETDGARLRRLREDAGVTQAHVAETAEVSVDQVRRFEQGRQVSERAATKLRWWAREREGGAG